MYTSRVAHARGRHSRLAGPRRSLGTQFLLFEYVPAPLTILDDTYKLRPGTLLRFSGGEAKEEFWYTPPQISDETHRDIVPWEKSFSYSLQSALGLRIPDDFDCSEKTMNS